MSEQAKFAVKKWKGKDGVEHTSINVAGTMLFPKIVIGEESFTKTLKSGKTQVIPKPKPYDMFLLVDPEVEADLIEYFEKVIAAHKADVEHEETSPYKLPYTWHENNFEGENTRHLKLKLVSKFKPRLYNKGEEYTRDREFKSRTPCTVSFEAIPYGPATVGTGISLRLNAVFLDFASKDEINAQQEQEAPKPKQPTSASPKKAVEIDEDDIPF